MQTLGLSGDNKRSDGWLKSLLWPSVENAWDVDYLGQQGMWICTGLAVFTFVFGLITGNILLTGVSVLFALFYLLGGMGVRQGSLTAAILVFASFALGEVVQMASGHPPGVLGMIVTGVLLSNVRGTYLASQWKPLEEGEDRPTRFNETLADKYIDQMPAKLWPVMQIPFIILAITVYVLAVPGMIFVVANRLSLLHPR
jgi:hypothetical protein